MKLKSLILLLPAIAALCSCQGEIQTNMEYRPLGNTGLMVSEIGLGCEAFADSNVVFCRDYMTAALDSGVNYIDIFSPEPIIRDNIGKSLKGQRNRIYIQGHIGVVWKNGQYKRTRDLAESKEGFEDLLSRLNTKKIEVGMIHYVDDMDDWKAVLEGGLMDYAKQLKREGRIKHIGMSSHNPAVALAAVKSGLIEVLMFSINPSFDLLPADRSLWDPKAYEGTFSNIDPVRAELYSTCQQMGVGISVMKVFGGGRLLDAKKSPLGKALTPCQCIHYALGRPAVSTALSGSRTMEELLQDLHYPSATAEEKDYTSVFSEIANASWKGSCIYCGHCAPCPVGINVAAVTKLLDAARIQGEVTPALQAQYDALQHKAGECTSCGSCESRCPFAVPVRENMKKAAELFEK